MRVAPQPLPYEEPPVAAPPPDSKAAPSSSSAAPPKDEIRPLASIFPRTHHKKLAVSAEGAQTEEAQAVPSTPEAQNRYRPLSIFSRGGGAVLQRVPDVVRVPRVHLHAGGRCFGRA